MVGKYLLSLSYQAGYLPIRGIKSIQSISALYLSNDVLALPAVGREISVDHQHCLSLMQ